MLEKFSLSMSLNKSVADLHSKILDARPSPPWWPKFFQFHAVFLGNFGKIICWRSPPRELAPPPQGNPGSATVNHEQFGKSVYLIGLNIMWLEDVIILERCDHF